MVKKRNVESLVYVGQRYTNFGSGLAARRYDDDKPRDERRKRPVALVKQSAVCGPRSASNLRSLFKFEEERGRISQRTCGFDALLVCEIAFRPDGEAAAAAAAGRAWMATCKLGVRATPSSPTLLLSPALPRS